MIALLLAGTFIGYLFAGAAWMMGATFLQALIVLSVSGVIATLALAGLRPRASAEYKGRRSVAA